jgi:MoxR-like ATPase
LFFLCDEADMDSHLHTQVLQTTKKIGWLREALGNYILGQPDLLTDTICCMLASGHLLLTGAPGLAKTTLVRVLAKHLQLPFRRVQCTPDLLPSDILGSEILNLDPVTQQRFFEFKPGPIFTNLLLVDEINRASPRTQSALLEAMQEQGVTVAGHRYTVDKPFMVFATQNPLESEGTFPLPEAQLDRFLLHTWVNYPHEFDQLSILRQYATRTLIGDTLEQLVVEAPLSAEEVLTLQQACTQLPVSDAILQGINELVVATRPEHALCPHEVKDLIQFGAGPRAALALLAVCQALALLEGQPGVTWGHVKRMVKPALRHRIRLNVRALRGNWQVDAVIETIMEHIETRYAVASLGLPSASMRI